MTQTAGDLVAALRAEGARITKSRRAICGVLADYHGDHLSAADIHERANTVIDGTIDQSTVYRTLDALESAGLITHTHMGHGALIYHLTDEHAHQHLVCGECGVTIGIPETELAGFFAELTRRTGFVADSTHVALAGLCADCAAPS